MRAVIALLALSFSAAAAVAAPQAASPEQQWKAGIADENKDYSQIPHAMLKIQDSAYIGEGQSAVLVGDRGNAASWHWAMTSKDVAGPDVIHVALANGKLTVTRGGKPVDGIGKSIAVDRDIDIQGQQTQVGAGVTGWRIFVYNQNYAAAKNFTGVSYYPFNPAYRVTARFVADAKLPGRVFRTSRGTDKQFFHAGDAHFILQGKAISLPFYAESNARAKIKNLSAFYTDNLTGKGAYGAGRYVDAQDFGGFPPASITIDFNQAYNPNCARSRHFTCPEAVDAIALAMAAGERDPHFAH